MTDVKDIFESDNKLFSLIKTAIEREVASQEMYKEALAYCHDPLLQKVLERLFKEETLHEKRLLKMYSRLRQKYEADGRPLAEKKLRDYLC